MMKKMGKILVGVISACGIWKLGKHFYNTLCHEEKMKEKNRTLLQLFVKWLENRENNKRIDTYLIDLGIHTVAIYGMSDAGQKLYSELKQSDIKVAYAIDRRLIEFDEELEIVSPDNELEQVDAIIVTAVFDYADIFEMLQSKTECLIISLEQIVNEM